MYIGDYTGRRAIYSPDAPAILDAGESPPLRLTYRELDERAIRLANRLKALGVGHRSRVGILALDGIAHLDLFFACSKLGAISVPYNWRLHWREQVEILRNTGPMVLLYSSTFKETVRSMKPQLSSIMAYVSLDGEGLTDDTPYETFLREGGIEPVVNESLTEEDIACLLFTGGTSGLPKGAQISHRQIAWNTLNTIIHDLTHGDVTLNVFPLFHTGGLLVYTLPLLILGGTVILVKRFDPNQVLELIETEKVTKFAGVPTMYQMLTQSSRWSSVDLSSLVFCTSGGSPLPVPLVERYRDEKGVVFKQGFGMTEWGPGCFALAPEDAISHAGSIGRPNFFLDARVVDEQNQPMPPGEPGELVFKGPSGFSGYFENPEATAEAFDKDGWFHTGDIARRDEGHYFFIMDRKKDMFISGGENVFPAEIEGVLYRHPAVALCAVVGVPDPKWGEVGVACVVLKPDAEATEEALHVFLKERLARYKVPRRVVIRESLPVSGAGKILKRELKEELEGQS